jgi:hypothetical protein
MAFVTTAFAALKAIGLRMPGNLLNERKGIILRKPSPAGAMC